jgi:hypothetical protein
MSRKQEKDKREGLDIINKRAAKLENEYLDSFKTNEINPLNNSVIRHNKLIAFMSMETLHTTLFHFIETVKVRAQARNIAGADTSNYFANQVEKKPLISGVISGFCGAAVGSLAFMSMFQYLTY